MNKDGLDEKNLHGSFSLITEGTKLSHWRRIFLRVGGDVVLISIGVLNIFLLLFVSVRPGSIQDKVKS